MPASDPYYVKNQIANALIILMKTEDFESISVTQLVKSAKVGRASFYRHYTDTKDVLRQYLAMLTEEWHSVYDETPDEQRGMLLLNHFYAHKDFYLSLYRAHLSEMVRESMQEAWHLSEQPNNVMAYLIAWYAGAAFGWIDEWIKRGMQETPKEMDNLFKSLIKHPA